MDDMQITIREQALRDVAALKGARSVAAIGALIERSESYTYRLLKGERVCSWNLLTDIAAKLGVSPSTIADIRATAAA